MGFLDTLFGASGSAGNSASFWKSIESDADLEKAIEESKEKKVAIFKHSTRCYISKMVLKNFEKEVATSEKEVAYYFLDLLQHREISNKIAEIFDVVHQSPQLIILQNGKMVKNASHQSITEDLL